MDRAILNATINSVRLRDSQGDCPTEPAFSVEHLEGTLLSLAMQTRYDSSAKRFAPNVEADAAEISRIINTPDDEILTSAEPGDAEWAQGVFDRAKAEAENRRGQHPVPFLAQVWDIVRANDIVAKPEAIQSIAFSALVCAHQALERQLELDAETAPYSDDRRTASAWQELYAEEKQARRLEGAQAALKLAEFHGVSRARYDAEQRAIKLWKTANPGHELARPEEIDLIIWLLGDRAFYAARSEKTEASRLELAAATVSAAQQALTVFTAQNTANKQVSDACAALRNALNLAYGDDAIACASLAEEPKS